MHTLPTKSALVVMLAAGTLLAACNRADDRIAGQKVDSAIATSERKADEMKADAKDATADARAAASRAGDNIGQAADSMGDKTKDMAITAEVKTKLAAEPGLSALAINVDTANGQVLLKGTAPDAAARDRATSLAKSVSGVGSVENQLTIAAK